MNNAGPNTFHASPMEISNLWSSFSSPTSPSTPPGCLHTSPSSLPVAICAETPSWHRRSRRSAAPIVAPFGYKMHLFVFHKPTKQIDLWSKQFRDLPIAVIAALLLDAPSAGPEDVRVPVILNMSMKQIVQNINDGAHMEVDMVATLLLDESNTGGGDRIRVPSDPEHYLTLNLPEDVSCRTPCHMNIKARGTSTRPGSDSPCPLFCVLFAISMQN
ncbi:hypothetical protein EJB05_30717, partial [Eragrostis curvula]